MNFKQVASTHCQHVMCKYKMMAVITMLMFDILRETSAFVVSSYVNWQKLSKLSKLTKNNMSKNGHCN